MIESFGTLAGFLLLIAPGLLFQLLQERKRPGVTDSAFRETARVALTSLALSSAAFVTLALLSAVLPTLVVDLSAWLRDGTRYAASNLPTIIRSVVLQVGLACGLAVAAASFSRFGGSITDTGVWFQVFRKEARKGTIPWLLVRLEDGSELFGYLSSYAVQVAEDRELVLKGPALQHRRAGSRELVTLDQWERVVVRGSSITYLCVQHMETVPRIPSPGGTRDPRSGTGRA